MKKLLVLLAIGAMALSACLAETNSVSIGSTFSEVVAHMGEPDIEMGNTARRVLIYENTTFILISNVVVSCETEKVKPKARTQRKTAPSTHLKQQDLQKYLYQYKQARDQRMRSFYENIKGRYGARAANALYDFAYFGLPDPTRIPTQYEYEVLQATEHRLQQEIIDMYDQAITKMGKDRATEQLEYGAYYKKLIFTGYSPDKARLMVNQRIEKDQLQKQLSAMERRIDNAEIAVVNAEIAAANAENASANAAGELSKLRSTYNLY